MAEVKVTKDLDNNTLIIEAIVSGPKDRVWQFYADKDLFEKWWGPEGWQTTAKEFDFREGGHIHYDMHCIDERQGDWFDQHSWGVMNIQTIDEGNGLTFEDIFSDETGVPTPDMPVSQTSVGLEEVDGRTVIATKTTFDTPEQLEEVLKMGIEEGWSSQLEKLNALLAE